MVTGTGRLEFKPNYAPRFAARLKTAVLKQDIWLEVAMEVGIMWNRVCTLGDFLFEVPIEMPWVRGDSADWR
jgi:hypothetical protein